MGLLPMDMDLLPPSDDRIFKLILTAPEAAPVLMDLVSALLGRGVKNVVVRNNELPPEDAEEKAERFDVNCTLDDGTQVDLEMQASRIQEYEDGKHENLKSKSIYYLCDLHASQSSKGLRRYDKLARSWQITFCSYTVFPTRKEYLNTFSLRHDRDNEQFSDAVHVVFVELSKLRETLKKPVEEMTDLDKWALFFKYANVEKYRPTINKVIETRGALQMAGEILMGVSKDERERAVFRSRRMYQTDLKSDLATAEDRGRRDGRQNALIEVAIKMLRLKQPVEEIKVLTGLSRDDIEKLYSDLQKGK